MCIRTFAVFLVVFFLDSLKVLFCISAGISLSPEYYIKYMLPLPSPSPRAPSSLSSFGSKQLLPHSF